MISSSGESFLRTSFASIVLTPLVALFTYVIIFAGIIALLMPHPLSQYLYSLCELAAQSQNALVDYVASWQWIAVEYTLSTENVCLCYALIAAITAAIAAINGRAKSRELMYDEPV